MIFRQLKESQSSTFSYLLGCPESGEALLIDPVLETYERDRALLESLGLRLVMTIETHLHADHMTSAKRFRESTGSRIAVPALDRLDCADVGIEEGVPIELGDIFLEPLFTPGHTDTHHAYRLERNGMTLLFSGDALLIEACGRTDFQSGDAHALYRSIHDKFFTLPDETLVYPCHDYEDRQVTTIGQEKVRNPRLGNGRSEQEFVAIMEALDLPYPKKIDFALPGNRLCGVCPDNVPEEFRGPCWARDQG